MTKEQATNQATKIWCVSMLVYAALMACIGGFEETMYIPYLVIVYPAFIALNYWLINKRHQTP